jgi:hypothetical protein
MWIKSETITLHSPNSPRGVKHHRNRQRKAQC